MMDGFDGARPILATRGFSWLVLYFLWYFWGGIVFFPLGFYFLETDGVGSVVDLIVVVIAFDGLRTRWILPCLVVGKESRNEM